MIGYYLLIAVAVLLVISLAWSWWKTGSFLATPVPKPYGDRESQDDVWHQRYPAQRFACADRVLILLCDAFMFPPDHRFKFSPDDKLMEIYRAVYPRWKFWQLGDSMELESLLVDLDREFGLEDFGPDSQTSIAGIVNAVLEARESRS